MPHPLLALLDILRNPQAAGFGAASQRLALLLEDFDPATLSAAERTALQANLALALENIRNAQSLTAQELGKTRRNAQALQSYARLNK